MPKPRAKTTTNDISECETKSNETTRQLRPRRTKTEHDKHQNSIYNHNKYKTLLKKEEVCNRCSRVFRSHMQVLHDHVHDLGKADDGLYACLMCDEVFPFYRDMYKHKLQEHKGEKWKCNDCGSEYGSTAYWYILIHRNRCYSERNKSHLCDLCGKGFKKQFDLQLHTEMAHNYDPVICEICKHSFKNQQLLKKHHLRSHKYQFTCEHCGKEFATRARMKRHVLTAHVPETEKPFICDLCGKGFSWKKRLETHRAIHDNLRLNRCTLCPHACNDKSNLAKHYRETHGYKKKSLDGQGVKEDDRNKLLKKVMENCPTEVKVTHSKMSG